MNSRLSKNQTISMDAFRSFDDIAARELVQGFFAKTIHTPTNTINFITVKAGHEFPLHQHVHHQCAFVLEGEFEMTSME
jgi:quercetin dioxygenase-like cupin family protein